MNTDKDTFKEKLKKYLDNQPLFVFGAFFISVIIATLPVIKFGEYIISITPNLKSSEKLVNECINSSESESKICNQAYSLIKNRNNNDLTSEGWYHLGLALSQRELRNEAIDSFNQAIKLNNKNLHYWTELIDLQFVEKGSQSACVSLEKARIIESQFRNPDQERGTWENKVENWEQRCSE